VSLVHHHRPTLHRQALGPDLQKDILGRT